MTTVDDADSQTFEAVVLMYVASSKLPDGDLAETEAARILDLTREHTPGMSPAYATTVVADVCQRLASAQDVDARLAMVVAGAERIAKTLSMEAKRDLVQELRTIVESDGTQTQQEQEFVEAVAQTFGL